MVEPLRTLSTAAVAPLSRDRRPQRLLLRGTRVSLEPLDPAVHADELFAAGHLDGADAKLWRWLWNGPFADRHAFAAWLSSAATTADPLFFAVRDHASGRARGMLAFLNIRPGDGVGELGHIWFAPDLQRTAAATEALTLAIAHVFTDLGYRRLEWKCDAANAPSRRAALRLGFRFEGIFFRHMIIKGRNRDTAWFSMLSDEWPERQAALQDWLAPANFTADGRQRQRLRRTGGEDEP